MHAMHARLRDEFTDIVRPDATAGENGESASCLRVQMLQRVGPFKGRGGMTTREHFMHAEPEQRAQRLHGIGRRVERPMAHGAQSGAQATSSCMRGTSR